MSIDPATKALIDNGLTVICNTNGMNMYDIWSIWLSYNLVSQKNKIDELSKKRVSSLSLEDLEYYLEYKKQQELSKVFRRVFDGIGSKEEITRAYDYADNHSLIELMINKLSKEELEYAKDKLYYLSTLKEDELKYIIKNELETSSKMVDQYILLVLKTKINYKSNKDLEEIMQYKFNDNAYMSLKSYHNASQIR